jgi:hypothetical protein
MDREDKAALRATWLASQRQSIQARVHQARLADRIAEGADLLPYVTARSCSDPRDRVLHDDMRLFRVEADWHTYSYRCQVPVAQKMPEYEPAPVRPRTLFIALLLVAALYFLLHASSQMIFFR